MKWKILPILWMALKRTCTFLGAVILIMTILSIWSLSQIQQPQVNFPEKMVLYMELDGDLDDLPKDINIVDPFMPLGNTVRDFVDALEKAKNDDRVQGIYAKMRKGSYSLAHIQEIRQGIENFKKSGKFAYIYATSFDDGLGAYYFASAFDEIWLQPMGVVAITGVNAEMPFFAEALAKIGVEPNFYQREDYKTAYESFTNSKISPENKEMTQRLVRNIGEILQAEISQDRGIDPDSFKTLVDKGLFIDKEAKDERLVDLVAYEDMLVARTNLQVTGEADPEERVFVRMKDYIKSLKADYIFAGTPEMHAYDEGKPKVALIYAVGAIVDTDDNLAHASKVNMTNDGTAAADDITSALFKAAKDPDITSVVLRINSPGGSPVASETILRAVQKVQDKEKKVYVSMGPAAASGGYWIAAEADRIFALPTTLTGSIGVLGGKISLKELWNKIGVNWERIEWGKNAGMWSTNSKFSESESERMNAMLDNIYDSFLERVSRGRNIPLDELRKIAGGRVWMGKSAIEIGLVDELGSLNDTLDYAARQAGVADRTEVEVVIIPKPLTVIEQFIMLLEEQATAGQYISVLSNLVKGHMKDISTLMVITQPDQYSVYAPIHLE